MTGKKSWMCRTKLYLFCILVILVEDCPLSSMGEKWGDIPGNWGLVPKKEEKKERQTYQEKQVTRVTGRGGAIIEHWSVHIEQHYWTHTYDAVYKLPLKLIRCTFFPSCNHYLTIWTPVELLDTQMWVLQWNGLEKVHSADLNTTSAPRTSVTATRAHRALMTG